MWMCGSLSSVYLLFGDTDVTYTTHLFKTPSTLKNLNMYMSTANNLIYPRILPTLEDMPCGPITTSLTNQLKHE